MQATTVPFGVVNAPGQRYHPVIIAQAIATLLDLFPDRLVVSLGSGEASNEHVTGGRWPDKPTRNARLLECVEVIRQLLRGDEVSVDGLVRVDRARLWTLPASVPPLYGAALSVETAAWCGGWADGLLTVAGPPDHLRAVIQAYREGGGAGRPVAVQLKVAYGATDEAALAAAHEQWRTNVFAPTLMADLELVAQFEEAARHVRPEVVAEHVLVSSDAGRHSAAIHDLFECGVDAVHVHDVTRAQEPFIDLYGERVLPDLVPR
jgi:G6PDH family F420-dependent oxidoreductase